MGSLRYLALVGSDADRRDTQSVLTEDGPWCQVPRHMFARNRSASDSVLLTQDAMMNLGISTARQAARLPPLLDFSTFGGNGELLQAAYDQRFISHERYLVPGRVPRNAEAKSSRPDWQDNARGIYYRHHFSPEWLPRDRTLWVPSVPDTDWSSSDERARRVRAQALVKHVLDNLRWDKAEPTWEADALADVFHQMRDDPLIDMNKHRYYTKQQTTDPRLCTLDGGEKFISRVPDVTFGLATEDPRRPSLQQQGEDFSYLNTTTLNTLSLHPSCGLISDPRRTDSRLVFPFAVYEAKGFTGDARIARRQACAASAVYLDMLDRLARQPGKESGPYQTPGSKSFQVFAFTQYGPFWTVMVGYKRKRLQGEHAGDRGMSDNVYVFHRIWSGHVVTERKAWELLSLVDQISSWGRTHHRDMVIQRLKPWVSRSATCYYMDTGMFFLYKTEEAWTRWLEGEMELPAWVRDFDGKKREELRRRALRFMGNSYRLWKLNGRTWVAPLVCLRN